MYYNTFLKFALIYIVLSTIYCNNLYAKEKVSHSTSDSLKTGWNFGVLPAISYSTDVGFQYGAAVNFYNYGDGSRYPNYNHSLYLEASRYTKGSGTYRIYYDSDRLIKGIYFAIDISYLPERAYDLYGFNGYEAVYNKDWENENSPNYRTRMFYKYQQNNFRCKADFRGEIGDTKFSWLAGFNLLDFKISSVNIDVLNRGKTEKDKLPPVSEQPGLYEKYQKWGVIQPGEADGGFVPELKGGVVYDTRDNRPNPMHGIFTEASLAVIPTFLGAETGFSKFSIIHRQYFTLVENDLSFAYRLAWQQTVAGKVPFYYEPQLISSTMLGSSSAGLGGSRTIRGILRNRVVGDGVAYGNLELRWKVARRKFLNQNFYGAWNGFIDFGMTTKKFDVENRLKSMDEPVKNYFNFGAEKLHSSVGMGLRLVMNYNFVMALDYGIALNKQDGTSAVYIGMNYIF